VHSQRPLIDADQTGSRLLLAECLQVAAALCPHLALEPEEAIGRVPGNDCGRRDGQVTAVPARAFAEPELKCGLRLNMEGLGFPRCFAADEGVRGRGHEDVGDGLRQAGRGRRKSLRGRHRHSGRSWRWHLLEVQHTADELSSEDLLGALQAAFSPSAGRGRPLTGPARGISKEALGQLWTHHPSHDEFTPALRVDIGKVSGHGHGDDCGHLRAVVAEGEAASRGRRRNVRAWETAIGRTCNWAWFSQLARVTQEAPASSRHLIPGIMRHGSAAFPDTELYQFALVVGRQPRWHRKPVGKPRRTMRTSPT
jgi:hypothetical protein